MRNTTQSTARRKRSTRDRKAAASSALFEIALGDLRDGIDEEHMRAEGERLALKPLPVVVAVEVGAGPD
jgi:hypothetical protein